jgi:hypothetical protein
LSYKYLAYKYLSYKYFIWLINFYFGLYISTWAYRHHPDWPAGDRSLN